MSTIALQHKNKLSFKAQTIATVTAIVSAVVLPQLFHLMGAASGLGTSLGEAFLPMHLPIIAAGLLAGSYVGGIAGALSPLLSFAFTGMPNIAMLPFMMIELCVYGITAGMLSNVKMPNLAKVAVTQLLGRVVRAIAILISVYGFVYNTVPVSVIWSSILKGIFGIVLQWTVLPLVIYRIENKSK